jgi:hypothetical protein
MGVNASTQKQRLTSIIQNQSKATCKTRQGATQEIKGLNISLQDSNCKDIQVLNRAKLASQCDIGAMASALAQASMELSADQTATLGLGLNVNTSEQDRTSIIKQKIEAECGTDQQVKQTIEDAVISLKGSSCDKLKVMNDLDATSQCVLKLAFDAVDKQTAEGSTKQTVKFPIGLSIGIGLGVVGLVIVAVIIIMLLKGGKKKPALAAEGEAGAAGYEAAGAAQVGAQQGGRRRRRRGRRGARGQINWNNVPITVIGILMLVWYAKMTEPKG